jgi:charged multivesicular body protein 6
MGSFLCPQSRLAKLDQQEQAIFDCKTTRDKIKAYIKRLEKNEKLRKEKAKDALKAKDRDRARVFLQQSKLYREQINSANGQLNMIEEQIVNIESAQQRKEAFNVLKQGNEILKKLNEEVNIEKWEKIADDMNEIREQQNEIGNFLKSHNMDEAEYEEAVDKELENLMKMEAATASIELPDAGQKEIKQIKKESNEEKNAVEA